MESFELEKTQNATGKKCESQARREWDRSEWFRLWLELIRQNSPQGAGH